MANLAAVLLQLRSEREKRRDELNRFNQAIAALERVTSDGARRAGKTRAPRKLSAAARKKIAVSQRARWAKLRQQSKAA